VSNNSKYSGTTVTLPVKDVSIDTVVYQPSKPVLDSELTFMTDLNSAKLQDIIRSKIPTGWLDANYSKGFDPQSNNFGVNTTNLPNSFILSSKKQAPMLLNANGWLLQIGGTGINADNKVRITLPEAPSATSRADLVFLEFWKATVEANSSVNKPTVDRIYKFGNTQYVGNNLEDNIVNPTINFITTKRVQIQYRIRVAQGPDFLLNPEGISDPNTVNPQGPNQNPISEYTYSNAGLIFDDYGMYIAGNGSEQSRQELGTVDGYIYAVPMFRIHRRNKGAFSTSNQNGSAISVTSGQLSDRPDGLFYDQISINDIEDLRHSVSLGSFNLEEMLQKTLDEIYSGSYSQVLVKSKLEGNLESAGKSLFIDKIASSTEPNVNQLVAPNGQQRYYSDVPGFSRIINKRTINNKVFGSIGADWSNSDRIRISVVSLAGSSAVIRNQTPTVRFSQTSSGPVLTVNGTWQNLGTPEAEFTIAPTSGLTNQDLYITYDLSYTRKGNKLTKPLSNLLKVENVKGSGIDSWGFVSINDLDTSVSSFQRRRSRIIVPRSVVTGFPDYAFTYRVGGNFNFSGIGTMYSYHINSGGGTLFTIPSNIINTNDVAYVYSVFNLNTNSFVRINGVQKNINGTLSVSIPEQGSTILRFDLALVGGILEFDERTQSVVELGRVDFFTVNGNGNTAVVLIGLEDEIVTNGFQSYFSDQTGFFSSTASCYINGTLNNVSVILEPNSNIMTLSFPFNTQVSDVIEIAVLYKKTLDQTDNLNIYYEYPEYKGITSRANFGNTSNSFVRSKVLYNKKTLDIITNGTGAVNTSEYLPKKYEPLIPKLPIANAANANLSEFIGTIHTSKNIIGGSYSLNTPFNTPYTPGNENFFTKQGVSQEKGTNQGGRFVSSAEDGEGSVHKIVCGALIEVVEQDGTNNFLPGELALKIETNYLNNSPRNRITNSSTGETDNFNTFDLFKLEGKPLIKLNSK
jgi:hypothetical protein